MIHQQLHQGHRYSHTKKDIQYQVSEIKHLKKKRSTSPILDIIRFSNSFLQEALYLGNPTYRTLGLLLLLLAPAVDTLPLYHVFFFFPVRPCFLFGIYINMFHGKDSETSQNKAATF